MELGGFDGVTGPETDTVKRKRSILSSEGVEFDESGKLRERSECLSAEELSLLVKKAGIHASKEAVRV